MQNLLAFLLRYKFFFMFLALEVVAFTIIINHSLYQRYILINSANKITGVVYTWQTALSEYLYLRKINRSLAEENTRLHELLDSYLSQETEIAYQPPDTLSGRQYRYIPAKVISNSTNKRNNYLMIDKGRRDGVDRDMAVISPEGVVGIVINASDNYAWIMSVLNSNTKINGRLKDSNYQGSLSWNGNDYRIGTFNDVPSHVPLKVGDTLVTSGYSLMFPGNVMIGTIKEFHIAGGDHFYTVKLSFSVDYNRLSHVYVVKNLMRQEQLSIMSDVL